MSTFHSQKIDTIFKKLHTTEAGLTDKQAEQRLKKHGPNKLSEEKPISQFKILISQFKSPLIYVLIIAGVISIFIKDFKEAGIIFGAVIINTIIGYYQENKANQALAKLKKLVEQKAIVIRDGEKKEIDSTLVTIGDIILIKAGNRITADARLIEVTDLQIEESSLTGESIPSSKNIGEISQGAALADRENMVYSGTTAVRGNGKAVVCAIGKDTEIGKIAELVKVTEEEKTPLQKKLIKFSKKLTLFLGIVSFFVFSVGVFYGVGVFSMFETAVALAVASIPEGLVVSVTVILVIGMQQILKQKALTRKLVATETLGSTTVICTDKTGTITEGKMHVAHIVIGEEEFNISGLDAREKTKKLKVVNLALQTALMCNDAVIENPKDELASWRIIGAPTEAALLSAAIQSGMDKEKILKIEPKISELPFTSENKYMITLHKNDKGYILYEKGAPEILLKKSSHFYQGGQTEKLTKLEKTKLEKVYEKLTNKGLRVIAVAIKEFEEIKRIEQNKFDQTRNNDKQVNWHEIDFNLTFIGFIALKDPVRPGIKETIKISRQAGIRPIIITGDHQLTAKAVAEEIGIKVEAKDIITGEELEKISDKKLKELVKTIDIYARVSPHHKLRIITALKERGEVVAMTGDGINDSPALKAADIGLSLGTGTDIAKETSDIILLDNNFKTIVEAVRQGRVIFSNIRKVITYLISDAFSEMILITGSIFFGLPLAILPAQILWINIVNDGFPHFSLAKEKGDKNIMKYKPIKTEESIMNDEMKVIVFGVGVFRDLLILALFIWLFYSDLNINYLRTIMFALLGVKSLASIFSIRSFHRPIWRINPFSNLYMIGAVAISFILLVLAIYWSPLQSLLGTTDINDFTIWIMIIFFSILNIVMIEYVKYYFVISYLRKSARA